MNRLVFIITISGMLWAIIVMSALTVRFSSGPM